MMESTATLVTAKGQSINHNDSQINRLNPYYINTYSLLNKKNKLLTICTFYKPDILMITAAKPKHEKCATPIEKNELIVRNY